MNIEGWKYYNFAAYPSTWPHEDVNLEPIYDKTIWKMTGSPLLARWTSDWDKKEESQFYYCIKDDKYDISTLKSKRRYIINKARRLFETRIIDPNEYKEEIYEVYLESLKGYPKDTVPKTKEQMFHTIENGFSQKECVFFATFEKETGLLCAYSDLYLRDRFIPISTFTSRIDKEKDYVNFALLDGIGEWYNGLEIEGAYLCDGARNVLHQTNFQDFLNRYFGFRYAYCTLHIIYKPPVKMIVSILFPFRKLLYRASAKKLRLVASLLKMEAWKRNLPE